MDKIRVTKRGLSNKSYRRLSNPNSDAEATQPLNPRGSVNGVEPVAISTGQRTVSDPAEMEAGDGYGSYGSVHDERRYGSINEDRRHYDPYRRNNGETDEEWDRDASDAETTRGGVGGLLYRFDPHGVHDRFSQDTGEGNAELPAARFPKRGGRRRMRRPQQGQLKGRVSAYCVAEEIQTEALLNFLATKPGRVGKKGVEAGDRATQTNPPLWKDTLYLDVVHSTTFFEGSSMGDKDLLEHKDIIYFPYGCVLFWGCKPEEEKRALAEMHRFLTAPVSASELEKSKDDMTFIFDPQSSGRIRDDQIPLRTMDPKEKLSFSHAVAQSAKLFVFEERLEDTIDSTKHMPQVLARTGSVQVRDKEIAKMIGRVFIERNEVNLHSDILDTPEFFWEVDHWEADYERLCNYLDIPTRVEVLNKRLDILRELLQLLQAQIANDHATHLEWIVIWLIIIEVVLELFWNIIIKDIMKLV